METILSNIKERVLQIAENKGIAKEKFFEELGVTYGNFKGIAKEKALSSDTLATIVAVYADINPEWLLTGNGEMYRDSIAKISDERVERLQKFKFQFVTPKEELKENALIPLVSTEAVAGFGNVNFSISSDDIQAQYEVPDFKEIDFMIRLRGSSMYPKYSAGDVVACRIIKESQFIQWNKTYVIATAEQGVICKRLRKSTKTNTYLAVSDNKDYGPFEIPAKEITGIALIVGVIRLE